MGRFLGLTFGLLLSVSALADATIEGASASPPYRLIRSSVAGTDATDTEWEIISLTNPAFAVDVQELNASGSEAVWTAPPGQYRVTAWIVAGTKLSRAMKLVAVREDAFPVPPTPPPAPNPNPPAPNPNPAPTPTPPTPIVPQTPSKWGFREIAAQAVLDNNLTTDQRMALGECLKALGDKGVAGQYGSVKEFMDAHAAALHQIPDWDKFAKNVMNAIQPRISELWKTKANQDPKIFGEWWLELAQGVHP
jgi:hypothetical protein